MTGGRSEWRSQRVVYRRKPRRPKALLTATRLIWIGVVLSLGLAYVGIYKLLHLPYLQIAAIELYGQEAIEEEALRHSLAVSMEGDRFYLIPRSNIFFFSPRVAEASLKSQYPEIKAVEIEKQFPGKIFVTIAERKIWGVYCGKKDAASECFFIDREAILFRPAPMVEGSLILTFHSDRPAPPLGSPAFTKEDAEMFASMVEAFREGTALPVSGFSFRANAPKDVWMETESGFHIIAAKDADPKELAGIVQAVLEKEVKGRQERLEYLDARFGNKVFIKYRN